MKHLTLILLFLSKCIIAQNLNSISTKYIAEYNVILQKDSTNTNSKIYDIGSLYIGDKISIFQSAGKYKDDSMKANYKYKQGNIINFADFRSAKFDFSIIKKFNIEKLLFQESISKTVIGYEEATNIFKWNLINKNQKISGYNCKLAKLRFRGRNYDAWYTTEIPFQDGPYKFNGLPGLIIKISDDKNYFTFELKSFEKKTINITYKNEIKFINPKDYYPTKINYLNAIISNSSAEDKTLRKKIIYNPIEIFK